MIQLTDRLTKEPILLSSKEIGAVKEVNRGGEQPYTCVLVMTDSGMYDHVVQVDESIEKIGKLIMAKLSVAGEEIRIDD